TFSWRRAAPLDNLWQRGVIGAMSAVGAVLVAFIGWPVDRLLHIPGLIVWAVASFIIGGTGSAWALKGSRDDALRSRLNGAAPTESPERRSRPVRRGARMA